LRYIKWLAAAAIIAPRIIVEAYHGNSKLSDTSGSIQATSNKTDAVMEKIHALALPHVPKLWKTKKPVVADRINIPIEAANIHTG
jgi:hypothetical protein